MPKDDAQTTAPTGPRSASRLPAGRKPARSKAARGGPARPPPPSSALAEAAGDHSQQLGGRIRDLRRAANLTLSELAQRTGVSIGTLSQLERGLVSPTVRTVFVVSTALGVSPAWLIDPGSHGGQDQDAPFVVRASRRKEFVHRDGLRKELISPAASTRLKGFFLTIEPNCGSGPEPYAHDGEEIGLVLSGTIELRIDDRVFVLGEGDCFGFASRRPHRFTNIGTRPACVFWINAGP